MIVSINSKSNFPEFDNLLAKSVSSLQASSVKNTEYFLTRKGAKLEQDVFEVVNENAKGTSFEGTVELISGQQFPDIVAYVEENRGFGIEVKTTIQNHWKTTGSSIFESTRIDNVERIYLFFGKLVKPIEFRCRRYEECLYDVAVTHSPRYLVDMETALEDTIFDKVQTPYDQLRHLPNPFAPIKDYFRKQLRTKGEDVWWIDKKEEITGNIVVRLWGNLKPEEKRDLRNQAMAFFPQMFGKDSKKYARVATWLGARHGIVSPSLRDTFTAGGKVDIIVKDKTHKNIPKIFEHLQQNSKNIVRYVERLNEEDLSYYWEVEVVKNKRIDQWISLVVSNTKEILEDEQLDVDSMIREAAKKRT